MSNRRKSDPRPAPTGESTEGPPRESFPLAIGPTDHLETQMVAHHVDEDGQPKPPLDVTPAEEA